MLYIHIPKEPETYENVGHEKKTRYFGKTRGFNFGTFLGIDVKNKFIQPASKISAIEDNVPRKTHKSAYHTRMS